MKKPDDIIFDELESDSNGKESFYYYSEVVKAIKSAQIDVIEETCKRCSEEATTKSFKLSKFSKAPRWKLVKEDEEVDLFSYDFITKVDKQSILKVADKMKEKLE